MRLCWGHIIQSGGWDHELWRERDPFKICTFFVPNIMLRAEARAAAAAALLFSLAEGHLGCFPRCLGGSVDGGRRAPHHVT